MVIIWILGLILFQLLLLGFTIDLVKLLIAHACNWDTGYRQKLKTEVILNNV